MFTDSFDEVQLSRPLPWRKLAVLTLGLLGVSLAVFLTLNTDLFTHGKVRNLPVEEQQLVKQIEAAGIRVEDKAFGAFGAPPHLAAKVRWQRDANRYAVTAVEVRNVPLAQVLPFLDQFDYLEVVRAPNWEQSEIESLSQRLPRLKIAKW